MPTKPCKFGARVKKGPKEVCPPRPCADGAERTSRGLCPAKPCKHGERQQTGSGGPGRCPPKPGKSSQFRRDSIQGITRPAIRRLLSMAGVKTASLLMYEETRGVLTTWLRNVIRHAAIVTEYRRRSTVTDGDVLHALEALARKGEFAGNVPSVAGLSALKACPASVGVDSAGKCLAIPRAAMGRLVTEILRDQSPIAVRFSPAARDVVHVLAERYLLGLFRDTRAAAASDKKKKVLPAHVQAVRVTRGERRA